MNSVQSKLRGAPFRKNGVYLFVCLIAVLLTVRWNDGTIWRNDNQLIFSLNPMRGLRSSFNIWDVRQNMGGTGSTYLPFQYSIMAVIRFLGFSLGRAQQMWVCLLLMMGGMGASRVAFALRPRAHLGAFVTGVVFITSPFIVGFLFPTWLFVYTVICPWILAAVIEGSRGLHLWKWSAIIGLAVAAAGSTNIPALAYSLFPSICWAIIVFISVRTARKNLLKLSLRVTLLTVPIYLPIVIRILLAKGQLEANLVSTETTGIIYQSSSWFESWRGFGSWILYWNPGGKLVVRYFEPYISSPWLILSTITIPAIAIAALIFVRGWERFLLAGLAVIAVALMVGSFPANDPSLFGQVWTQLLQKTPLFAMRNSYKAGSILITVIALLIGFLSQELWQRAQGRKLVLTGATTIFITLFAMSSSALWSGAAFTITRGVKTSDVPDYWYEAMDWLGAQDSQGSFLITPPGQSIPYLWGDLSGGDIFPSLAKRPYLLSTFFGRLSPDSSDTVEWLSNWLARPGYRSGDLTPIAQRIGLRWVVIRNDLSLKNNSSFPSTRSYDGLRNDPGIKVVKTFGPTETTGVPAIEILQVADPSEARIVSLSPPTIVSGDAEAWGLLSRTGQLDNDRPFRFSGSMSDLEIGQAIRAGSPIVVTDTNRRRSGSFGSVYRLLSIDTTKRVRDRFQSSATQTVAEYNEAKSIKETYSYAFTPSSQGSNNQVKSAFDGDSSTSWLTGYYSKLLSKNTVKVIFKKAEPVKSFELVDALGNDLRGTEQVGVTLLDGSYFKAKFIEGKSVVTLPERREVNGFTLTFESVKNKGDAPFGLSEVIVRRVDGSIVDLSQVERLPVDIAKAVGSDPNLLSALDGVDLQFVMERNRTTKDIRDSIFARTFKVPRQRVFSLKGRLDALGSSTDERLSQLVSAELKVTGSSRRDGLAENSAVWTIDGDLATAWKPEPGEDSMLTLDPGGVDVSKISLIFDQPTISSLASPFIKIQEGEKIVRTIDLRTTVCQIGSPCTLQTDLEVNNTGQPYQIIFPASGDTATSNWSVYEVSINQTTNTTIDCINNEISVDSVDIPIRITNREEMLNGPIDFQGCTPISIKNGWNDLRAAAGVASVWLTSPGSSEAATPTNRPGKVSSLGSTGVVVESTGPAWVLLPRGLIDNWSATVNGQTVPIVALDTQTGVRVDSSGEFKLVLRHKLEVQYRIAAILSVLFTVLCLVLSLWPRRTRRGVQNDYFKDFHLRAFEPFATVGSGILILLIGGVSSWIISGIFIIIWWKFSIKPSVAVSTALISFVTSALTAIPPVGPQLSSFAPTWATERPLSNSFAQLASVMVLTSIFCRSLERWQGSRQQKSQ